MSDVGGELMAQLAAISLALDSYGSSTMDSHRSIEPRRPIEIIGNLCVLMCLKVGSLKTEDGRVENEEQGWFYPNESFVSCGLMWPNKTLEVR